MAVRDLIPWGRSHTPTTRTESTHPFIALHHEMNRLFDDFWRDFSLPGFTSSTGGWPQVELSETDKEVKVEAELPGLDDKDIELFLSNGVLTIRGEKKSEAEDKNRHLSERFYGRFERQISLPVDVQEDKIAASFKKGVLTVTLPKAPGAAEKAKRIAISGG